MADDCNEQFNYEFVKWILLDGRSKEKKEQYAETIRKYSQKIVTLKNRKETVLFLEKFKN